MRFSTGYIKKEKFDKLILDCDEICKILFSILKSTERIKQWTINIEQWTIYIDQ